MQSQWTCLKKVIHIGQGFTGLRIFSALTFAFKVGIWRVSNCVSSPYACMLWECHWHEHRWVERRLRQGPGSGRLRWMGFSSCKGVRTCMNQKIQRHWTIIQPSYAVVPHSKTSHNVSRVFAGRCLQHPPRPVGKCTPPLSSWSPMRCMRRPGSSSPGKTLSTWMRTSSIQRKEQNHQA